MQHAETSTIKLRMMRFLHGPRTFPQSWRSAVFKGALVCGETWAEGG